MADEKTVAANPKRAIAVLDKGGVLIERVTNPTDAQWEAAAVHCRFPNGFDNALKRYRLIEWRQGRWRFVPILHPKDAGAENTDEGKAILPVLARCMAVFLGTADWPTPAAKRSDIERLTAYLKSFDGQG